MKLFIAVARNQPVLYHATYVGRLLKILISGKLGLSFAAGTESEVNMNKGYQFFLSATREKYGNFARSGISDNQRAYYTAVLVLDPSKINSKTFPLDYWQWGPEKDEGEERIVSNKQFLNLNVIKEIHVYTKKLLEEGKTETLNKISEIANSRHIPIYFYDNAEYYKQQLKAKAQKYFESGAWEKPGYMLKRTDNWTLLDAFIDAYNGDTPSDEKKAKDVKDMIYELRYYLRDITIQLMNEAHNHKQDHLPVFQKLVNIMRKEKVSTIKQLVEKVSERFKE